MGTRVGSSTHSITSHFSTTGSLESEDKGYTYVHTYIAVCSARMGNIVHITHTVQKIAKTVNINKCMYIQYII